jgi:hypothetical protein
MLLQLPITDFVKKKKKKKKKSGILELFVEYRME